MKHYTPEDVWPLAQQVLGFKPFRYNNSTVASLINEAVSEAVEAEREACADLCDDTKDVYKNTNDAISITAGSLAKAIRARGVKED